MGVYVIQTASGKERRVAELIERFVEDGLIDECFVPRREVMRGSQGVWRKREELLAPGYLFVTCADVAKVAEALRGVPAFTRLLGNGDSFVPLTVDETAWLDAFTEAGDRTVRMSEGVIEGDKVVVLNGPLMGHEGLITKVDRHKRAAWVEMPWLGRVKNVKLGLEIVRKRN